jgi:hypothetical protein
MQFFIPSTVTYENRANLQNLVIDKVNQFLKKREIQTH